MKELLDNIISYSIKLSDIKKKSYTTRYDQDDLEYEARHLKDCISELLEEVLEREKVLIETLEFYADKRNICNESGALSIYERKGDNRDTNLQSVGIKAIEALEKIRGGE